MSHVMRGSVDGAVIHRGRCQTGRSNPWKHGPCSVIRRPGGSVKRFQPSARTPLLQSSDDCDRAASGHPCRTVRSTTQLARAAGQFGFSIVPPLITRCLEYPRLKPSAGMPPSQHPTRPRRDPTSVRPIRSCRTWSRQSFGQISLSITPPNAPSFRSTASNLRAPARP